MSRRKGRKKRPKPSPSGWKVEEPEKRKYTPEELRERYDIAQKLTRELKRKRLKEMKERGLSNEHIKSEMQHMGRYLPEFLLEARKDLIDKVVEQRRKLQKMLQESKRKSSKDNPLVGLVAGVATAFKDYLEGKRSKIGNNDGEKNPGSRSQKIESRNPGKPEDRNKPSESRTEAKRPDSGKKRGETPSGKVKDDIFSEVRRRRKEKARASEKKHQRRALAEGSRSCTQPVNNEKRKASKETTQEKDDVEPRGSSRVRVSTPTVRGERIKSDEHMRSIRARDFPGLNSKADLDELEKQVDDHLMVYNHFKNRKWTSNAEIRKFAEEIGAPEATVRAWVKKGSLPRMYSLLEEAMTKEEGKELAEKIRATLPGIETREKFDKRLKHPYYQEHVVSHPKYVERNEVVIKFYKMLDELDLGGTTGDVARRIGTTQSNVSRWTNGRRPLLIQSVLKGPKEIQSTERFGIEPIKSSQDKELLLNRHPHLRDMKRHPDMDRMARGYLTVKDFQRTGRLEEKTYREWAKELGISNTALRSYVGNKKIPEMFDLLYRNERDRREHEAKLSPVAFEHRIDPSRVYENFRNLRDKKNPTVQELADTIAKTLEISGLDTKVQWAELRPYSHGGPKWLRDIAKRIHKNREEIEELLNKQLGLDNDSDKRMRISVVDSKLYMRLHDLSEYNWMNIYKNELFYFKELQDKDTLLDETRKRLGIRGNHYLSDIINDLTDHERSVTTRQTKTDLKMTCDYLRGESLHLSLDATNSTIQDVENRIGHIGRAGKDAGKINNPKFPSARSDIDKIFGALLGASLSDGHVERSSGGFVYTESDVDRVNIFKEQMKRFGNVEYSEEVKPNGVIRIRYPSPIGRALERKGMPSGDKSLQNQGLPDFIKEGRLDSVREYWRNAIPEEVSFSVNKSNGNVNYQWDRAVVLRDPSKEIDYGMDSDITPEQIQLFKEHGKRRNTEHLGLHYKLTGGKLNELMEHGPEHQRETASSLKDTIYENPSALMMDEIESLKKLGIQTRRYLSYATLYADTGRVSALWHTSTSSKEDVAKLSVSALSADKRKRKDIQDWMNGEPDLIRRVTHELIEEGIIDPK